MKKFPILFILLVSQLLLSCGGGKETPGGKDMKFDVNPALIGEEVFNNNFGFRFSPPKEWNMLDPETFAVISARIQNEVIQKAVKVTPIYIFSSSARKCLLTVSTFTVEDSTGKNPFDIYGAMLSKEFDSLQLSSTEFTKSGMKFRQHLIQSGPQVNFKLLFEPKPGKYCQFDYVILKTNYNESTAKAIESSIGSILLLN